MKRLFVLTFAMFILAGLALSQSPAPTDTTIDSSVEAQPTVSPLATPAASIKGIPNLPFWVEMFASAVMLSSVFVVFVLVWRQQQITRLSIGPRHIQFVSVCLIVPTILILGLEQVLTRETTATLIGGLTGYLLSGLGKYEPSPKPPKKTDEPNSLSVES